MSAKKNPLSDKAYELYKQGMKLVDIAEQLGCSSATIRTWKNRYKWDSGGNATFQKQCETKCNVSEREISWVNIEHEYVTDIRKKPCTLEELATKHNIAIGTIEKYSMQHEWSEKRKVSNKKHWKNPPMQMQSVLPGYYRLQIWQQIKQSRHLMSWSNMW